MAKYLKVAGKIALGGAAGGLMGALGVSELAFFAGIPFGMWAFYGFQKDLEGAR